FEPSELELQKAKGEEWRHIIIGTLITFFCTVELHIIQLGEWAYMNQIDKEATSSFFGFAASFSKAAGVIFAFVFAFWAQRSGKLKGALLAGRVITLIACFLYICIEFVPGQRRFGLAVCYFLFGIGFSTSPLLRSYIAEMSSEENRSSAYSLTSAATIMSIIVGPIAQLTFKNVSYPGYEILPYIRLHIFSAPVWLALITNVIVILIILFLFVDVPTDYSDDSPKLVLSFSELKLQSRRLKDLKVPWILVALVLFEKCASTLTYASLSVIAGPMMTVIYSFTGEETVTVMAVCQIIVGLLAMSLSLAFIFCKLGKRISTQTLFLISKLIFVVGYILCYPWPGISQPLKVFNASTHTGCNPEEYEWCETEQGTPFLVFTIVMIIVMGLAIPSSTLSLDTIYSKILGNIDQNLMQALFGASENLMMVVGPIYAT
ncbi:hypothetical protein PENTCL1PPCAC_29928, partial [Pristionchus entomophagus]